MIIPEFGHSVNNINNINFAICLANLLKLVELVLCFLLCGVTNGMTACIALGIEFWKPLFIFDTFYV